MRSSLHFRLHANRPHVQHAYLADEQLAWRNRWLLRLPWPDALRIGERDHQRPAAIQPRAPVVRLLSRLGCAGRKRQGRYRSASQLKRAPVERRCQCFPTTGSRFSQGSKTALATTLGTGTGTPSLKSHATACSVRRCIDQGLGIFATIVDTSTRPPLLA